MVDTECAQLGDHPVGGFSDHVRLHQVTRWIDRGAAQDGQVNRARIVAQCVEHRAGHLHRAGDTQVQHGLALRGGLRVHPGLGTLLGSDRGRRAGERVQTATGFRERDHIAQ
jgi:hypothetical protein